MNVVEAHVAAVVARLRSDPQISGVVFEGEVTGNPARYVNVWHDTGFRTAHDALAHQSDVEVTFTVHSVGVDRWQATWTSGRVNDLLVGFVPAIGERRCWQMVHAGSAVVQKDTDVTPPRFFAADRFTLKSTPA